MVIKPGPNVRRLRIGHGMVPYHALYAGGVRLALALLIKLGGVCVWWEGGVVVVVVAASGVGRGAYAWAFKTKACSLRALKHYGMVWYGMVW